MSMLMETQLTQYPNELKEMLAMCAAVDLSKDLGIVPHELYAYSKSTQCYIRHHNRLKTWDKRTIGRNHSSTADRFSRVR